LQYNINDVTFKVQSDILKEDKNDENFRKVFERKH
jgi:hypothetical protein